MVTYYKIGDAFCASVHGAICRMKKQKNRQRERSLPGCLPEIREAAARHFLSITRRNSLQKKRMSAG